MREVILSALLLLAGCAKRPGTADHAAPHEEILFDMETPANVIEVPPLTSTTGVTKVITEEDWLPVYPSFTDTTGTAPTQGGNDE